nr:hypothetical protein [Sphingobium lignivorans]
MSLVSLAIAGDASAQDVALPTRLAQCQPQNAAADAAEIRYRNCFPDIRESSYAAAYISFNNDRMNLDAYLDGLERNQRRSFLTFLRSLFVSNTDTVLVVARIVAKPGGGRPDELVGSYTLMKIFKSDRGGDHFSVEKLTKDGFEGPIFSADSTSRVVVQISYAAEHRAESNVSGAISQLGDLLGGISYLRKISALAADKKAEIKRLDDLITSKFNRNADFGNAVDLGLDPAGTQAFYGRLTLGKYLDSSAGGNLHVAVVPVASVLVNNAPVDPSSIQYGDGRWDPVATRRISDRYIDGLPLSSHVRQAMGDDYLLLSRAADQTTFNRVCDRLSEFLSDPAFGLSGTDSMAATWAFIAGNPLLKSPPVRANYCLSAFEQQGILERHGLGLPPLSIVPDAKFDSLIAAAQLYAARADESAIAAQQEINRALVAETRAALIPPPEGYSSKPLGGHRYAGQTVDPVEPFHGVATETMSGREGNRYEGQLTLAGSGLIYEGLGRYVVSRPGTAGWEYRDYTGDFQANWFSGNGVMRWPDGREFKGQFARDLPSGYGILSYPSGERYHVRMVDGLPNGPAVREQNGERRGGNWISGTFVPE